MDSPRAEKVAVVDEVRDRFSSSDGALLTEYRGIDVAAMAELRRALRQAGGDYRVYKNTLVRLAVSDLGLELEDLLVGPTAIAFVRQGADGRPGDAATVAKALADFAKGNEALVVKGGILGGQILSADDAKALAELPSRDQLFAQFAGSMEYLLSDFAGLLEAKLREFTYAMDELLGKGTLAPGEAPPDPEPAPESDADQTDEPAADGSAAADQTDEPAATDQTDESATDESATDESATDEPATDESVAEGPTEPTNQTDTPAEDAGDESPTEES